MTATQKFIEDAIKGGYDFNGEFKEYGLGSPSYDIVDCSVYIQTIQLEIGTPSRVSNECHFAEILLDPLAWQAVGKTRGWADSKFYHNDVVHLTREDMPEAKWYCRCFMNELWNGLSIEEALVKL